MYFFVRKLQWNTVVIRVAGLDDRFAAKSTATKEARVIYYVQIIAQILVY